MLDAGDWHPNPQAPRFASLGSVHVRYAKALMGSPPRRRTVLSVFSWAVEAVRQYLAVPRCVRCFEPEQHPAIWVSERRGRVAARALNDRFAADARRTAQGKSVRADRPGARACSTRT